jgi:predicted LPLAT superfamily acyltransferase
MLYLIRWIALHLGRKPARLILYPITLYFLLFAPAARRASVDYLSRVLERPVHWGHVARHIFTFSATILDRVYLLTGRHALLDVQIHNFATVQERLDAGSGCILLGSHLGSFEVLRALAISRYRFPVKILMHEEHNETITRILHSLNPDIADSVIRPGTPDALLLAREYLRQGYLIGILGDRASGKRKTLRCNILGSGASLPTGPLLAAAILEVPVILFFGIYRGGNHYDIYFEKLADRIGSDRRQREREVQFRLQKYADRLSWHARHAPYNWFNFYDFWETGS